MLKHLSYLMKMQISTSIESIHLQFVGCFVFVFWLCFFNLVGRLYSMFTQKFGYGKIIDKFEIILQEILL